MSKWTIKEVAGSCASEGLGYAVQHYLGSEVIEDRELAQLWKEASDALNRIDAFFEKHLGRGWDEE